MQVPTRVPCNSKRQKGSISMTHRVSTPNPLRAFFVTIALALTIGLPSQLHAQRFQTVPALAFTKVFAGANPLPQVLTIAYTDQSTVRFSAVASSNGNWLSVSPGGGPVAVSRHWLFQ